MAATAGTATFIKLTSGETDTVDLYIPDAVATAVVFNPSGLAVSTGQPYYKLPEDSVLFDVSIGTAPTAVGAIGKRNDATVNGLAIRWANQLQTLANRQKLRKTFYKDENFGFTQF